MREIKFRAWANGIMHYPKRSTHSNMQHHNGMGFGTVVFHLNPEMYVDDDKYTLLQYTGLKDKNGVEIYEGDIVTIHDEDSPDFNAEVFYHERWGTFEVAATGNTIGWYTDLKNCVTVIGNIHENPELL